VRQSIIICHFLDHTARKVKRAKLRKKQLKVAKANGAESSSAGVSAKSKPRSSLNDYSRPAKASSSTLNATYRPAHSAVQEDDFMASLLSSVTATTNETISARKRRSSPDFPSSDPAMPSSDSSFFSAGARKRYGQESDDEVYPPRRSITGKKPRVSDATVVPNENEYTDHRMDMDMDVDMGMDREAGVDSMVKEERISDAEEDVDMEIKPRTALTSAATKLNQPRRKVVNSTAVKHVKPEPIATKVKAEPESPVKKPVHIAPTTTKPVPNGSAHWSTVQEDIKSGELEQVRAPVGSVKPENVLEEDGTLRIFWLDQMEQDGVVHLVGKVLDRNTGRYVSACLSINGIKRNLFVKPRAKRVRE
jgi:DNA polymerase alpha subunit A